MAIQAFLQTWLFFGLLHEAIGPVFEMKDFATRNLSGEAVLSTSQLEQLVKNWSSQLVSEESVVDLEKFEERCSHLYRCLVEARGIAWRVQSRDSGQIDPRIMLAIAALAEYLHQAMNDARNRLDIDTFIDQPWRIGGLVDLGQPIIHLMRQNGWCPNDIVRLDAETRRVGTLYYYSNLEPPRPGKDHSSCSATRCVALHIDPTIYKLAHKSVDCACPVLYVDSVATAAILSKGSIPLIEIEDQGVADLPKINIREVADDHDFVAISHLWAEGSGNPDDNALHGCLLSHMSTLINQLPKDEDKTMPFWLDTLCVPLRPPELQTLALNKMREPYERAKHVLVLDSYLQSVESKLLSTLEIFARINCCSWMRRLWTLQEGKLGRSVWFQFADGAVELMQVAKDWSSSLVPSLASHGTERDIILGFTAAKAHEFHFEIDTSTIYWMREVLSTRSVSVDSDEALCLACLMNLDTRKITSVPPPERMKAFWSLMKRVPVGFVFSKAPQKLNQAGFHWAPSTFLGPLPKDYWAGPQGLDSKLEAIPTDSGLLVVLPGYVFHPSFIQPDDIVNNPAFYDRFISDTDGYWYTLGTERPWGKVLNTLKGLRRLALLLAKPFSGLETFPNGDASLGPFNERQTVKAMLATVDQSQGEINYVSAHRHATVTKLGPGYQGYFQAADKCAQQVFLDGSSATGICAAKGGDCAQRVWLDESATLNVLTATAQEKCDQRADTALQNHILLELCKAEARFCGTGDSTEEVTSVFRGTVRSFYQRGAVHVAERTAGDQKWCVD